MRALHFPPHEKIQGCILCLIWSLRPWTQVCHLYSALRRTICRCSEWKWNLDRSKRYSRKNTHLTKMRMCFLFYFRPCLPILSIFFSTNIAISRKKTCYSFELIWDRVVINLNLWNGNLKAMSTHASNVYQLTNKIAKVGRWLFATLWRNPVSISQVLKGSCIAWPSQFPFSMISRNWEAFHCKSLRYLIYWSLIPFISFLIKLFCMCASPPQPQCHIITE